MTGCTNCGERTDGQMFAGQLNPEQAGGGGGAESAHRLVLPSAVLKR